MYTKHRENSIKYWWKYKLISKNMEQKRKEKDEMWNKEDLWKFEKHFIQHHLS